MEANVLLKNLCVALDNGEMRIIAENDNLAIINVINGSWLTH